MFSVFPCFYAILAPTRGHFISGPKLMFWNGKWCHLNRIHRLLTRGAHATLCTAPHKTTQDTCWPNFVYISEKHTEHWREEFEWIYWILFSKPKHLNRYCRILASTPEHHTVHRNICFLNLNCPTERRRTHATCLRARKRLVLPRWLTACWPGQNHSHTYNWSEDWTGRQSGLLKCRL